ncbi:hypothetical protein ACFFNY_30200 [Paenibacillus hodogayensis]|uniref:RNase H type-1 domain-containing protein n=1 Tax=Paenibacillus hodogayensis TaxID=279208 RepID=A0ABV5W5M1_9BACL
MKNRTLRYTDSKDPLSKIPTDRLKEMQRLLHDRGTITVYSDCSAIQDQNIISVAACFVGDGETRVESRKLYVGYVNRSVYAELKALTFAISMLPKILERYSRRLIKPEQIIVYTDYCHIDQILYTEKLSDNNFMREAVSEVLQSLEEFKLENKGYDLTIRYIGDEKKHNMYYSAAHNSARRLLGKK